MRMQVIDKQNTARKGREPVFNVPPVVLALIAVLVAITLFMLYGLDEETSTGLILAYGFVPADWISWLGIDALTPLVDAASLKPDDVQLQAFGELASYLKDNPGHGLVTALTYAFLHGGLDHVGMNAIWLLAFGSPVARRIGSVRFLVLFLVSALGGAVMHYAVHPTEVIPLVGASGAIAGIMAGAVRFMFQPGEPLSGFAFPRDSVVRMPPMPIRRLWRDPRPLRFILLWIAVNLITGLAGSPFIGSSGSIAWEAHLGGFFAGLFAFSFVDPPVRLPDDEEMPLQDHMA